MPESPKLEQSAPRGRVTTARSPPVPLSPLSFGDGVARKGAQEDASEPGMGHGSQCLHVCKRLVLCKKRKKETPLPGWSQPSAISPVSCAGQPWDREPLCVQTSNPPLSPHPHTPSAGSSWEILATGRQAGTDKLP